jgi:hypothetical protein
LEELHAVLGHTAVCSLADNALRDDISLDSLLQLAKDDGVAPSAKSTAIRAFSNGHASISDDSRRALVEALIPLLTSPDGILQRTVAKFLAKLHHESDRWRAITVVAIKAASTLSARFQSTSQARALRNLINRAVTIDPNAAAQAAVEACANSHIPLHVSELLRTWAEKYTTIEEAPVWHEVLTALSAVDRFQVKTRGQGRVTFELSGPIGEGDPLTHFLWNVNGFTARWRSSENDIHCEIPVGDSKKQRSKRQRYIKRLQKPDFRAIILRADFPDLITIVESKLSLSRMIALPGFISWCDNVGYRHITLSWSASEAKGRLSGICGNYDPLKVPASIHQL